MLDPKALRWDAGVTGGGGGAASGRATAREARPEAARGQVLLAVLTEFWLSDADEPLPDAAAPAGALEHSADMWGATDSIASLRCAGRPCRLAPWLGTWLDIGNGLLGKAAVP